MVAMMSCAYYYKRDGHIEFRNIYLPFKLRYDMAYICIGEVDYFLRRYQQHTIQREHATRMDCHFWPEHIYRNSLCIMQHIVDVIVAGHWTFH